MSDPIASRRAFLAFLGRGAAAAALTSPIAALSGCKKQPTAALARTAQAQKATPTLPFTPLPKHLGDSFALAKGFKHHVVASWGDVLNAKGETFGYNNDFTAYLPLKGATDGLLWVNHESPHRLFVGQHSGKEELTAAHIERERQAVGGSLMRISQDAKTGQWQIDKSDKRNKRFSALTTLPLVAPRAIMGKRSAKGTLANCCGGTTPWGSVLTCEENADEFYGNVTYEKGKRTFTDKDCYHGWHKFFPEPPEHYGWVVEINPRTGQGKKLTALGRFAHEGATVVTGKDGRCVVYMGDDSNNQCIYKFVAATPKSLEQGELFVANVEKGEWVSLDIEKHKVLQQHFRDQTEVLICARQAAKMVGGTPMDRPEGIQVDPKTKAIYVCLTNNKPKGNLFGAIFKIEEQSSDFQSKHFTSSTFLAGGPQTGFACPDNIAFDPAGNLWMTNDISGSQIGKGAYEPFGHNSLHCIPLKGPFAGQCLRVAAGPVDAELTGMSFTPDGKTLFLSVQHPGARSESLSTLTSHWPGGGKSIPKPSVVAISGPALDALQTLTS